jgi:hypothetical protein
VDSTSVLDGQVYTHGRRRKKLEFWLGIFIDRDNGGDMLLRKVWFSPNYTAI